MKVSFVLLATLALCATVYSHPIEETYEDAPSSGWRSWNAFKRVFHPIQNYFNNDLPKKTPTEVYHDIYDDASDKVNTVHSYVTKSNVYNAAKKMWTPIQNWIEEAAEKLKNRTFGNIYKDVESSVATADNSVGEWLEHSVSKK